MSRPHGARHPIPWRDLALVALGKLGVSLLVLSLGFEGISDDDFARVTLAQSWAIHPRLDPTGTSWLPLPFWTYGSVMALFGRSLAVARVTALLLGIGAMLLVYVAGRWILRDRAAALAGTLLGGLLPYGALLGVAPVPELPTAALCVLGIASTVRREPHLRLIGAAALLAACWSRYEPWAVAGGFAAVTSWDVVRAALGGRTGEGGHSSPGAGRVGTLAALLALLGPVSWIVHNQLAHGDALHFVARVSAYKLALAGVGDESALGAALGYPLAFVQKEPELALCALALLVQMIATGRASALREPSTRRVVGLGLLLVAGLSLAAVRGGAPTHHEGRTLLAVWLLTALFVARRVRVVLATTGRRGRLLALLGAALVVGLGAAIVRPWYGHIGDFAHRRPETAIGETTGRLVPDGERVLLEIIDYGYFAVLAGSGRPELFVLDRDVDPRVRPEASSFESPSLLRGRATERGARWVLGRGQAVIGSEPALGTLRARAEGWSLRELR